MENLIKERGITLVALVITVIVMLILAGMAINFTIGDNGIFKKSEQSATIHNKEEATEKMNMKITSSQMHTYIQEQRMPTLQELADALCEDEEMEYVVLESKAMASLNKITVGEKESIFTKIKKYPYEFEINSRLQLASIDGVKIANDDSITVNKAEYEQLKKDVEMLKNTMNLENTKPKLVATIEKNFGTTSGTFNMDAYNISINEEAKELLEYNATDKNIVIKESGFYTIQLKVSAIRIGTCWGSHEAKYNVEDVEFIKAYSYGFDGSHGYDINSVNMYLTKGQHISFNNTISFGGNASAGTDSVISIQIFKMSK